jgi:hypothetical protein
MESKLINDTNGQKTYALIFDSGDEVVQGITDFAKENMTRKPAWH